MKHDREKAHEIESAMGSWTAAEIVNGMCQYAEHLNRWRPISERPEIGQWVIVDRSKDKSGRSISIGKWSDGDSEYVDGSNNVDHWTWKPLDLPETSA